MITDHKVLEDILLYCGCFHLSDTTRAFEMEENGSLDGDVADFDGQDEKEDVLLVQERRNIRNRISESNWREENEEKAESVFVIDYKPAVYVHDKKDEESNDSATLKFVDPEKRPKLFLLPWEEGAFRDPVRDSHLKTKAEKVSDALWYKCDMLGMIWSIMDKRLKVYGKSVK